MNPQMIRAWAKQTIPELAFSAIEAKLKQKNGFAEEKNT